MRMRVAKICPPINKPTRLISPKLSGPEVGLLSGDYCIINSSLHLHWSATFDNESLKQEQALFEVTKNLYFGKITYNWTTSEI